MNKSVPLLSTARLLGGLCVCLLAFQFSGRAQPPTPSILPVANPEPTVASVETPASENKPNETTVPANDTEILASQGATFAAKDRIAVFNGDVRVKDPRFVLACDKLTIYIAKGAIPGASTTPPPVETPAKADDPKKPGDTPRGGGIDRAVAEGHVTIIQKHAPTKPGEEEKVSIGRADIVEFDNKTGDTILRGMPKVEQNGNFHEALSRSTTMTLGSDNSLKTVGPSRTYIAPRGSGSSPTGKPGTTPASSPAVRRTPASGTQN